MMKKKEMVLSSERRRWQGRERGRGVGIMERWCKWGKEETEVVLREGAEAEEEEWAFTRSRRVQKSP